MQGTNSVHHLVLYIKCYWNTIRLICLHYLCLLSRCTSGSQVWQEPYGLWSLRIYCLAPYRKCLLSPAVRSNYKLFDCLYESIWGDKGQIYFSYFILKKKKTTRILFLCNWRFWETQIPSPPISLDQWLANFFWKGWDSKGFRIYFRIYGPYRVCWK